MEYLIQQISTMAGGDSVITGFITMWALGVGTYLVRFVPMSIYQFMKRTFTTTLTITDDSVGYEVAVAFSIWLEKHVTPALSRTLSISKNNDTDTTNIGIGYGIHYLWHDGRLFWIKKEKIESSGSEKQKNEFTINTYGRSHTPIKKLIAQFFPQAADDTINVYAANINFGIYYDKIAQIKRTKLNDIAIDPEFKNLITSQIDHFLNNREWYQKVVLPHKLTYILHGEPGTGKTNLIRAIAGEYGMNIYTIDITKLSSKNITTAFSGIRPNSIILLEDIDSSAAVHDRDSGSHEAEDNQEKLALTSFLNVLDGVVSLDQCLVFMTTNHLEKLDPAVYRKGRVDYAIEVGYITKDTLATYVEKAFNTTVDKALLPEKVKGCDIRHAMLESKGDVTKFIAELNELN